MRRIAALAVTGLLGLGLLVSALPLASAGPERATATTVTFEARVTGYRFVDEGRKGQSPGDSFVFRYSLWNESDEKIGTRFGECTFTFGASVACTVMARLDGRGGIAAAGVADLSQSEFAFPIVGGTGEFQNVTGEAHITVLDEATEHVEIHLEGVSS